MIKVEIESNEDGYMRIEVKGHGNPLVCSAVSATMQSAAMYLERMAREYSEDMEVAVKCR